MPPRRLWLSWAEQLPLMEEDGAMGLEVVRRSRSGPRYVMVEDRQGMGLPYSKGLMATSIMATGLPPEQAFALAEAIEQELLDWGRESVSADELAELAGRVLALRLGSAVAESYRAWRRAKRSSKPIVVLIGGATGVGKSTVATRLGARLGITRIIPTDAVREVMRNIISEDVLPSIHVSSFEVHRRESGPAVKGVDPVLAGFQRQAEAVAAGLKGLVARAVTERVDIIVEGAHVLPGLRGREGAEWSADQAAVVEVMLGIDDPAAHRAHFLARQEHEHGRRPDRYLKSFAEIRRIQSYLGELAVAHGVPQLDSANLDATIQALLEMVVRAVTDEVEFSYTASRAASRLSAPITRRVPAAR
ncbi:MAG: hypothetical protein M3N51_10545 [Actinomycetota bacterium]|nr:hypothetical protein [Actinomycetota bacterium]